jgi:predicted GTPase
MLSFFSKPLSKPASAAKGGPSPSLLGSIGASISAAFGASIFSNLPVTQKMRTIERIQQQSRKLDQECNPKSKEAAAPAEAPLKLPRAIVFGDESAGKSSTIERIAQNDIFPRDKDICTRMPTVLKLRPNKDYPTSEPMFILTIPECQNKDGVYNKDAVCTNFQTRDVRQIRDRIKKQMQDIKTSGKGCESDQEITVELHSEGVLHIDLVDLPGLRQVAEKNDQHLIEALEACTKKYIESPETGVILCVLTAQNPNIQTTASLRLLKDLKESKPRLTYSCVAVLTNTDMSRDWEWEQCEPCKSGPCHRVEDWLSRCDIDGAGDGTESELRGIFKAGFVALVNRSQNIRGRLNHTLEEAQEFEMNWFLTESGMTRFGALSKASDADKDAPVPTAPNELGSLKLGLPALVGKIDRMIRRFMSEDYIPREIDKQQAQAEVKRKELLALGVKPNLAQSCSEGKFLPQPHDCHYEPAKRLTHQAVFESATEKVNAFLLKHIDELDFTSAMPKAAFDKFNNAKSRLERSQVKLELQQSLMACVDAENGSDRGSAIALGVMRDVLDGIRKQFDDDKEGDLQLARFQGMAHVFEEEARKDMEAQVPAFQEDVRLKGGVMFTHSSGCTNLDTVHGTAANLHSMICGMLAESVIQTLLCPLLAPGSFKVGPESTFLQRATAIVDKDVESFGKNEEVVTFVERKEHLAKRTMLEQSLQGIHDVIKEWKEMVIPAGDVPLQEMQLVGALPGKTLSAHAQPFHLQAAGAPAFSPSAEQATSA